MTSGLEITVFVILPFHIFSPLFGYFWDDDPNDNDQYNMSYVGVETAKKTCLFGSLVAGTPPPDTLNNLRILEVRA